MVWHDSAFALFLVTILASSMRKFLQKIQPIYRFARSIGDNRLFAGSSYFDEQWYRAQYDLQIGKHFCIGHYLRQGAKLGLDPSPYFSTSGYLEDNPDVAKAGINPLVHFLRYGQFEGRMPKATHSAHGLDEMLWSGVDECVVLRELHEIVDGKAISSSEKIFAAWALVRWYAAKGDWPNVEVLLPILREADSRYVFLASLPLVEIDGMLHSGLLDLAEIRLNEELKTTPDNFDLHLARANLFGCQGNRENERLQCLNDIYRANGLSQLKLKDSEKPLTIDNLQGVLPHNKPGQDDALPLVSVLVPAFNSAETLVTALDSLAKQIWQALEVIIIDDASTDNTLEIAEAFAAKDARFRVLRRPYCEGAYAARNFGLSQARGEFITVHDADDWSHPEKIERQVQHLLAHPELMACASHWVRCTDCLEFGAWRIEKGWVEQNISSWMFRRKAFRDLGYWDRVKAAADTEFYYRLIQAYGDKALAEVLPGIPLSFGRVTSVSLTGSSETHIRTSISGVRKMYIDAARRWHKGAQSLYVETEPETRKFPIPPLLKVDVKVFEGNTKLIPGNITFLIVAHSVSTQVFGAEFSLLDIIASLRELKVNVLIAIPELENQKYFEQLRHHASKVFMLPYRWWRQGRNISNSDQANFQHILRRFSVDVLYCNTSVLWEPLLAARACGIRTVIHVHELLEHDSELCKVMNAEPNVIRQHILGLGDRVIAPSLAVASWLASDDRVTVLPNVVDDTLFSLPIKSNENFCVALISSNIPKKGLKDFVELARYLVGLDISCLLIGPDNSYINELKQQQSKDEIPKNIRFPGISRNSVEAVAQADVIVNLSHVQESFGRTILEAMAAGRPVVCYDWGALPELVIDGETGYLVPFGDIDSVAMRIVELFNNPDLRRNLGINGRKTAHEQFGKDKMLAGLNSFIRLIKDE